MIFQLSFLIYPVKYAYKFQLWQYLHVLTSVERFLNLHHVQLNDWRKNAEKRVVKLYPNQYRTKRQFLLMP